MSNLPWIMDLTFQVPTVPTAVPTAVLFFAASDFTFITRHIYNWVSFPLWPSHFILSGATTNSCCPLVSPSSILDTFWPVEFIFPCHIFLFFIQFMGFSWHVYCCGLPFFSPVGLPCGSEVKASAFNAGDPNSIPGSGRSPGEGNGNPLQYSCLENPMDGEAW